MITKEFIEEYVKVLKKKNIEELLNLIRYKLTEILIINQSSQIQT